MRGTGLAGTSFEGSHDPVGTNLTSRLGGKVAACFRAEAEHPRLAVGSCGWKRPCPREGGLEGAVGGCGETLALQWEAGVWGPLFFSLNAELLGPR